MSQCHMVEDTGMHLQPLSHALVYLGMASVMSR